MTARERELELLVVDLASQNNQLAKQLELQKKTNIPLSQLLNDFIANNRIAETTKCGYSNIVSNHLIPYFINVKLLDICTELIDEYVVYKQNTGLSNQTIRHHLTVLKSAFSYAKRKGIDISYKIETTISLCVEPYQFEILTFDEINLLISELKNHDIYLPVFLSSILGLRRSEAIGLKWDCINFKKSEVQIDGVYIQCRDSINQVTYEYYKPKTKTQSSKRTYIAPQKLMSELLQQRHLQFARAKSNSKYNSEYFDYVCVKKNGDLLKPNFVTKKYNKIIKSLFPNRNIRFHDLRHSCGTFLYEKFGYGIKEIQTYLGHANPAFTAKTYIHTSEDRKQEMSNCINNKLIV